jgi:dTDP-4-amino-4,6-dideoxygalactose transaminase
VSTTPSIEIRQVPLLDLAALHAPIRHEIDAAMREVTESEQFILGAPVQKLEQTLASYCGVKHAVGCASGSDALYLALLGLGIGPGDLVYVPAFTFFATAGAVSRAGAVPVFVDIDPATYNLDPDCLAETVRRRPGGKAIIVVHLYGGSADMDPILRLASEHGMAVIEDGAQAIGAEYNRRRVLSLGQIGCLSFFPTKNLGGFGDGGMLTTNQDDLAVQLRALRVHGSLERYRHDWIGINSRLDTLQAAVLLVKSRYLDQWTQARQDNAARYEALLGPLDLPIELPRATGYQTRHVFNQYVIRCRDREPLRQYLASHGVGTEVYYPSPLHRQPCYVGLGYCEGDMPVSGQASRQVLALPVHPGLRLGDVDYICRHLCAFYGG